MIFAKDRASASAKIAHHWPGVPELERSPCANATCPATDRKRPDLFSMPVLRKQLLLLAALPGLINVGLLDRDSERPRSHAAALVLRIKRGCHRGVRCRCFCSTLYGSALIESLEHCPLLGS